MLEADAQDWGRWLRGLRDHAGLTQKELASRIGVEYNRIIHWEKGRNIPSGRHLIAIFQACGFTLETSAPQPPPAALEPRTLVEQVSELTDSVVALRAEVLRLAGSSVEHPSGGSVQSLDALER